MPKKVKEPVGVIMRRPLPDDAGTHLLFITRPAGGPFSQGGTAIFAVEDSVESSEGFMDFTTAYGPLVFSKDMPFMMIPRALCTPVTIKELAAINLTEKKEWDKAYKDFPDTGTTPPSGNVAELALPEDYRPGNYA